MTSILAVLRGPGAANAMSRSSAPRADLSSPSSRRRSYFMLGKLTGANSTATPASWVKYCHSFSAEVGRAYGRYSREAFPSSSTRWLVKNSHSANMPPSNAWSDMLAVAALQFTSQALSIYGQYRQANRRRPSTAHNATSWILFPGAYGAAMRGVAVKRYPLARDRGHFCPETAVRRRTKSCARRKRRQ